MKLKIKNERYSEIKGEVVRNPYDVDCEIKQENKSTYRIFVPKWDREIVVKKEQVYN